MKKLRFYLGGVPFGKDNIGDEAILAAIIKILRQNFLDPEICVATNNQQELQKILNVKTTERFGFDSNDYEKFKSIIKNYDAFIWSGATGLSDYPHVSTKLMDYAKGQGVKTIIWGTGMDDSFNSAHFSLSGKKLTISKILSKLSLGLCDFKNLFQKIIYKNIQSKIIYTLRNADLVVLRDFQSQNVLKNFAPHLNTIVACDSAIILDDKAPESNLQDDLNNFLNSTSKKIAVCISAQRIVKNLDAFISTLDKTISHENLDVIFIPTNPQTDFLLMKNIQSKMKNKLRTFLMTTSSEDYQSVLTVLSKCSLTISSRLHLLILSANMSVPIIGISRGTKVNNFLSNFGIDPVGSIENCNLELLQSQIEFFLMNKENFIQKRNLSYSQMLQRLSCAIEKLKATFKNNS